MYVSMYVSRYICMLVCGLGGIFVVYLNVYKGYKII